MEFTPVQKKEARRTGKKMGHQLYRLSFAGQSSLNLSNTPKNTLLAMTCPDFFGRYTDFHRKNTLIIREKSMENLCICGYFM